MTEHLPFAAPAPVPAAAAGPCAAPADCQDGALGGAAHGPWLPPWPHAREAGELPLLHGHGHACIASAAGLFEQALAAVARRRDTAVALSLKLPFCGAHCLCCDRQVRVGQPGEAIDDYIDGLLAESRLLVARLGTGRDVQQLHLGGGSVNELAEQQLVRLVDGLRRDWRLPADAEMSADCDPRRVDWAQLRLLRGLGFRWLRLGVLDFDPQVQWAIGRFNSPQLVDDVCNQAREAGIACLTLELMVGLPHQTMPRWEATLRRLVDLGPDRIVVTPYRHRPAQSPGQYAIDAEALPSPAECRELSERCAALLQRAGYRWIGADQFVLDTDVLARALDERRLRRGVIGFTSLPVGPTLGLGVGAVSDVDAHVFWHEPGHAAWRDAVGLGRLPTALAVEATPREVLRRAAVQQLLCEQQWPRALAAGGLEKAYERLAARARDGVVRVLEDRLVVTDSGRHVLPALCAELSAGSLSGIAVRG